MYVVTVKIEVKAESVDAFLSLIQANAKQSVELESGCLLFDVAISNENQKSFFLYEVYKNEQAFQEHLDSAHFKEFDSVTSDMISTKKLRTFVKC